MFGATKLTFMKSRPITINKKFAISFPLFLAVILRAIGIGRESVWFDEAISLLTAELRPLQILSNVILDPHPPLYYLTLRSMLLTTVNEPLMGRWISVFFNLLLLAVVWKLSQVWLTKIGQRFTAVFLIAISPFQLLYSHEIRMYSMLMLLNALMAFFYLKSRQEGAWWWITLALTTVLAIYTHFFSIFILAAIFLHALVGYKDSQGLRRTVWVCLIAIIVFVPWLMILAGESNIGVGSLRPLSRAGDADIIRDPLKPLITLAFLLFGQSFTNWYTGLALFFTAAIAVIFILEFRKALQAGDLNMLLPFLIVICVVGGPVLVYMIRPFFLPERTMAPAAPFMIILLAWGTTRHRSPLPLLVGLSTVLMLIGSVRYLTGDLIKPPYQEAADFVAGQVQPNDLILHTSDGSYLPSLCYGILHQQFLLAGDPDQRKPTSVYETLGGQFLTLENLSQNENNRLWLIVALEHSIEWQEAQVSAISTNYKELETNDIGGIRISLFDLNQQP